MVEAGGDRGSAYEHTGRGIAGGTTKVSGLVVAAEGQDLKCGWRTVIGSRENSRWKNYPGGGWWGGGSHIQRP